MEIQNDHISIDLNDVIMYIGLLSIVIAMRYIYHACNIFVINKTHILLLQWTLESLINSRSVNKIVSNLLMWIIIVNYQMNNTTFILLNRKLITHSNNQMLNTILYSLNLKYLLMVNLISFEQNKYFESLELSQDQSSYENMIQHKIVITTK
jgi:hypothetical protein